MSLRLVFVPLLLLSAPQLASGQSPEAVVAVDGSADAEGNAAAYVPKTPYDNTPYRFNAGKRFTAAEFDAWMKARGIRVAKGKPAVGDDATVVAAPTPATETAQAAAASADMASAHCTSGEHC